MTVHYTAPYLLNPQHKITIDLVGMGGTGSRVISGLARINEGLCSMGHPGIHVRAWDDDIVTTANIGRQLFSAADIGQNKAVVLASRINRYFGYEWEAMPMFYGGQATSNILITCVDSAKARVMLGMKIEGHKRNVHEPTDRRYYWMDFGNSQKTGQCVLGTLHPVKQKRSEHHTRSSLQTVTKKFRVLTKMMGKDDDPGPSCSLAEALEKQDLFINSTLAEFGCNIIWKLFKEGMITHHGCFVNLDTLTANPIKIV
ncbi:MAG: PRTRC system ThiF family protein [Chitinophagaceae bacterium]